jgi:cell division protein FtsL
MTLGRRFMLFTLPALWCAVLGASAGAIYAKYRARELFVQLEQLNNTRNNLDAEWGRLQLEQSAWSNYGYVERIASERLHMAIPESRDIQIIAP